MSDIWDINGYLSKMQKSIDLKMNFWEQIITSNPEIDTIIDFGCADGALLNTAAKRFPQLRYFFGIDNNPQMIKICIENHHSFGSKHFDFLYQSEFEHLLREDKIKIDNSILILSSVIHEVYNYEDDIASFWNFVFGTGFKFIAIRDMFINNTFANMTPQKRSQIQRLGGKSLRQFEKYYGNIKNDAIAAVHYLMKYFYKTNWDREVKENYFCLDEKDVSAFAIESQLGYVEVYKNYNNVPYVVNKVKKDFGISIDTIYTHCEFIFKRCVIDDEEEEKNKFNRIFLCDSCHYDNRNIILAYWLWYFNVNSLVF